MSIFNKKRVSTTTPDTTNDAGGPAIKQSKELEAVSLVLTSFVKDKFYKSGSDDLKRLHELAQTVDPLFMAKLAVFARTKFGMRSITHALAAYLAPIASGSSWGKYFYEKIVHRVDDMQEIIALVKQQGEGHIPNALKKGFAKAFENFNEYQLAKYKTEKKMVKLVDVVNLVHPKHTPALKKLVDGTLKSESTWESKLSATQGKEKGEAWTSLIQKKELGYIALIRNLKNIEQEVLNNNNSSALLSSLVNQITNREAIRRSLVLPFQIKTAYEMISNHDIMSALNKALEISLENVPVFPGKTAIFLDQSGSMSGVIGIASLFAAVLAKTNNATVITFGENANYHKYNPQSLLVDIQSNLNKANLGGTDFDIPFATLQEPVDRIIILSDMQAWMGWNLPTKAFNQYKQRTGRNPFIYSFDLEGSGTMQFKENKVFALAGFHGDILKIMSTLEEDREALLKQIKSTVI